MEKATINILGLGETLQNFNGEGVTMGVNDINSKISNPVNYLVLQDPPFAFDYTRFENITKTPPKNLVFSQFEQWEQMFYNFQRVEVHPFRANPIINHPNFFHSWNFPTSVDSSFLAVVIAYRLGFKNIKTFGVDFTTHPAHSQHLNQILEQYENLLTLLKPEGLEISCSKYSQLSRVKNITLID